MEKVTIDGGSLLTKRYPIKYPLQWFIEKTLSWGFWQFFSTGTYAIIGTTCVESETCYENYHEKKMFERKFLTVITMLFQSTLSTPLRVNLSAVAAIEDTAGTAVVQNVVRARAPAGCGGP